MWRNSFLIPTAHMRFEEPGESGSGGGAGGGSAGDPPPSDKGRQQQQQQRRQQQDDDDPSPGKETFSREYVSELRGENKGWRLKASEERQKREAAEADRDKARAEAEEAKKASDDTATKRATEAEAKANDRIIRSELRTLAIKAGMIDLDGLKLADLSTVKLNDKDEIEGGDELIAKLKEDKPYLFKEASSGTTNTTAKKPPEPGRDKPKHAREMTKEEYAAARAAATK